MGNKREEKRECGWFFLFFFFFFFLLSPTRAAISPHSAMRDALAESPRDEFASPLFYAALPDADGLAFESISSSATWRTRVSLIALENRWINVDEQSLVTVLLLLLLSIGTGSPLTWSSDMKRAESKIGKKGKRGDERREKVGRENCASIFMTLGCFSDSVPLFLFFFLSFIHCFLLSCFFYFFLSIFSPLLFLSRGFSSRFFWTRTGHAETELHFNGHWPRSARFPTPFARQPTSTLFYSHPFTHAVDKNNLPINARPPAFLLASNFHLSARNSCDNFASILR